MIIYIYFKHIYISGSAWLKRAACCKRTAKGCTGTRPVRATCCCRVNAEGSGSGYTPKAEGGFDVAASVKALSGASVGVSGDTSSRTNYK